MARRFVRPEEVRLELSDGDYLIVKKYLNVREARRVLTRQMKPAALGEQPKLDPEHVGLSKVLEYVLSWGGPGFDGVAFTESAVDNLDPATFTEIMQAIDAHEDRMEKALAAEKNSTGENASVAISPSAA